MTRSVALSKSLCGDGRLNFIFRRHHVKIIILVDLVAVVLVVVLSSNEVSMVLARATMLS